MMNAQFHKIRAGSPASLLAASLLPLLVPGHASAGEIQWSAGTGDFGTDTNWSGGAVPASGDIAVLGNGGTVQITSTQTIAGLNASDGTVWYLAGSFNVNGPLRIGTGTALQSATLDFNSAVAIATAGASIGETGSTGHVAFNNGFIMFPVPGTALVIGNGAGSTGSINQASGFIQCSGDINLAIGAGAIGSLSMSSGTGGNSAIVLNGSMVCGQDGGHGTLTVSDSSSFTKTTPDGSITFGKGESSTATVSVSGGHFVNTNADTYLGASGSATATLTISGATSGDSIPTGAFKDLYLAYQDSASATVNLNGGALQSASIHSGSSSGDSILNLNGGILRPADSNTDFLSGLTSVNVKPGGAIVDTSSGVAEAPYDIDIAQDLLDAGGGLTKRGPGMLTLSGTCSHSGNTVIEGGALSITGSLTGSDITVEEFGTLRGTGSIAGSVSAAGYVWPGVDLGTLSVGGDVEITGYLTIEIRNGNAARLATAGALDISAATLDLYVQDLELDQPVYVLATYGTLVGSEFADSFFIPEGYEINYAYEGNKIALVSSALREVYDTWAGEFAWLVPSDSLPIGDPDHDGIPNSIEFYTGGNPLTSGADSGLPAGEIVKIAGVSYFQLTFNQSPGAIAYPTIVETSKTLAGWSEAGDGVSYASIPSPDGGKLWTVTMPIDPAGSMFARLKVAIP